jgi:regulatory protein
VKVTRLKALARRPGFVTVFVDEARFAVLPIEEVRGLGLREALELDEPAREALETAAERGKAYDAAVKLLAVRGRSTQEIVERLRRKGLRKDAVAHAIGRLESEGLLNDAAFAREYAQTRISRGFGRARIAADLSRKGVSRHDAELAVAEAGGDDEQGRRERLLALARKRAGQLKGVHREVARRRLIGYLARRGYGGAGVLDVVDQALDASTSSSRLPASGDRILQH